MKKCRGGLLRSYLPFLKIGHCFHFTNHVDYIDPNHGPYYQLKQTKAAVICCKCGETGVHDLLMA